MKIEKRRNSLAEHLKDLLKQTDGRDITLKMAMDHLAGRGHAVLLILFSLPFCLPIQIPGFSTPFGIIIAFIGLRISFGHRAWLPKALLEKKVSYHTLEKVSSVAIKITDKLRFIVSTKWVWLVQNQPFHTAHGLTITLLATLLMLPLPIPFTNLLAALPILAFGLAILEDDGLMIVIAYFLALICFTAFISLILFGKEGFLMLMNSM